MPINPWRPWEYSAFAVDVTRWYNGPRLELRWTFRNSFVRIGPITFPSSAIDGNLMIRRIDDRHGMMIAKGDGYPSMELYYRVGGRTIASIRNWYSGDVRDLFPLGRTFRRSARFTIGAPGAK